MNKNFLVIVLFLFTMPCFADYQKDEFAEATLSNVTKPQVHSKYNYESTTKIPIKMTFTQKLGTEKNVYEGEIVELKLLKGIVWEDKVIAQKDSIVKAKIGIIISTGMNGIPASVILKDFEINNIDSEKISDSFELTGQDRSLLVFPLKWALTFLPPTGSLTNFIMGGHVKLKPRKIITIYYYPEWI